METINIVMLTEDKPYPENSHIDKTFLVFLQFNTQNTSTRYLLGFKPFFFFCTEF